MPIRSSTLSFPAIGTARAAQSWLACVASVCAISGLAFGQQSSVGQSSLGLLGSELVADASKHSSMLGTGTSSTVNVGGATQFRYVLTYRGEDQAFDDDITSGFQTRNTLLWVTGEVGDFRYRVQAAADRGVTSGSEGVFTLQDAYITVPLTEQWSLGLGQISMPVVWEEWIDYWKQLAIERSTHTSSFFNFNRVQGVWAYYEADATRAWVMVNDGLSSLNSDYDTTGEGDYGIAGRAEYKWAGAWSQFDDFTAPPTAESAGKAGIAMFVQNGGSTVGSNDLELVTIFADVAWENAGWTIFAQAGVATSDLTNVGQFTDWGFMVHGGYYFTDDMEFFARFDAIFPDDDRNLSPDPFSAITVGANYYPFARNTDVKFSMDLVLALNDTNGSNLQNATETGLLRTSEGGQFAIKAQLQLVFGQ